MSCEGDAESESEAEYFCKDFEWEEVRADVESNPSYGYHLLPFEPSKSEAEAEAEADVRAWKRFHVRHSSGKFFKVPFLLPFPLFTFHFSLFTFMCPKLTHKSRSGATLFAEGVPRTAFVSPKR